MMTVSCVSDKKPEQHLPDWEISNGVLQGRRGGALGELCCKFSLNLVIILICRNLNDKCFLTLT